METIKTEKVTIVTQYKAIDGTVFNTESECRAYEETADAVITAKYNKHVIAKTTECGLFDVGSDEHDLEIVSVTKDSLNDILLKCVQTQPHYKQDKYANMLAEMESRLSNYVGKNVIIYRGYELDYFSIIGTLEDYIENLKSRYNKLFIKC